MDKKRRAYARLQNDSPISITLFQIKFNQDKSKELAILTKVKSQLI